MRILILILQNPMWLIYLISLSISLLFVECLFLIDGTLALANYFRVLQNLLFSLSLKSAIMKNSQHHIN